MGQPDFLQILRRQPFEPFRIVLTNGQTYDVRHPDMALVTRTTVHIGVPAANAAEDAASDVVIVSLLHIVQVQFLNTPATSGS